MHEINLVSPAKINLFLNVLGKRKDGYYSIVTLLERIDLCDEVKLSYPYPSTRILVNDSNVPQDKNNICYKVVKLFKKYTDIKDNIKIDIKKNIPPGSGLGGASSNAASTLSGLNSLFGTKLSFFSCVNIAKKIGVDVVFFLYNKSFALAKGRGDVIYPICKNWRIWHVVVKPDYSVSTKLSYKRLNSTSICKSLDLCHGYGDKQKDVNFLIEAIFNKDLNLLAKLLYNNFEQIYDKKVSKVKKILFNSGIKGVCLSGTGSGVFGIASNRKEAYDVKRSLNLEEGWQVFVVRTL